MRSDAWTIVKVGGSLFDLPDLRTRLTAWLAELPASRLLLVPGGGGVADAIRDLDRTHQLGEEASHWLAIQTLSINAHFLQSLVPTARLVAELPERSAEAGLRYILDAYPFFRCDEQRAGCLPHVWQVTSDSLAARVAIRAEAAELILLKSTDWQGADWAEAGRAKVVDDYFATVIQHAPALRIRVVNLRDAN